MAVVTTLAEQHFEDASFSPEAEQPAEPQEEILSPIPEEDKGVLETIVGYFKPSVRVNDLKTPGADVSAGPFAAGAHLGSLSVYSRAGPFGSEASVSQMRFKANAGSTGFYAGFTSEGPKVGIYSSILGWDCPRDFEQPVKHLGQGTGVDLVDKGIDLAKEEIKRRQSMQTA
jgi:hypothetical protein